MPLYRLMLEDYRNVFPVSLKQVQAATGQRSPHYAWDDVSKDWIADEIGEKGMVIKEIKPK